MTWKRNDYENYLLRMRKRKQSVGAASGEKLVKNDNDGKLQN